MDVSAFDNFATFSRPPVAESLTLDGSLAFGAFRFLAVFA